MVLAEQFTHKGHDVRLYKAKRFVQMVGGSGTYYDYRATIDGQDVSEQVIYGGEIENWGKYARELIDRMEGQAS